MENLDREVQRYLEAGIVKSGYDPRNNYFYATGNFLGVRVSAYIAEEDVDWSRTTQQEGEAMVAEKLHSAATEAIRTHLQMQEEAKLGFGFVR